MEVAVIKTICLALYFGLVAVTAAVQLADAATWTMELFK